MEHKSGVVGMMLFENATEAMDHADEGGIALHVWKPPRHNGRSTWPGGRVPDCFARSRSWAHLFCRDAKTLNRIARRLGVRKIIVSRPGRRGQHVDLCGRPLQRAVEEATGN